MVDMISTGMLLSFLPSFLYAIAGLIDAHNKGEKINYALFIKTILVGLVSAGLVSSQTADQVTAIASSTIFTIIIDQFVNSLWRKARPPPAPTPTPTPPAP